MGRQVSLNIMGSLLFLPDKRKVASLSTIHFACVFPFFFWYPFFTSLSCAKKYPSCVKTREDNWDSLNTYFAYPPEVRKIIYTANIIEGLNRQFRQVTKNKPLFINDDSLRKLLYLAAENIVERWTQRCRNWDFVLSQLNIIFQDRIV